WLDQLYLYLGLDVNSHSPFQGRRNTHLGDRMCGDARLKTRSEACAPGDMSVLARVAAHREHRLRKAISENANEDRMLKCENGEAQAQTIPGHFILESMRCIVVVRLDAEELREIRFTPFKHVV